MEPSATRSGIYAGIAMCGGFVFGLAACFAIAFIMLGCPEARGRECEDAASVAKSITKVWYLFAVPIGAVAGLVTYRGSQRGTSFLRNKIAESRIAKLMVYATGIAVVVLSLLMAAIVGSITSYRAGAKCPIESASACTESGSIEIISGWLIVVIAISIAIGAVIGSYRITRKPIP